MYVQLPILPNFDWAEDLLNTNRFNKKSAKEYQESGAWKCRKSPTGAHFFVLDYLGNGKCSYCTKKHEALKVLTWTAR